jgi:hypothetical protein
MQPGDEASPEQREELLRVQVQLLFRHLERGYVTIADHLAETTEALKEVEFDKLGRPLLHTVPERVRSLARTHALIAMARKDEVDDELAAESPINAMLPDVVEVDAAILEQCTRDSRFLPLAFELYSEATGVLALCGGLAKIANQEFGRNQAICAGSLVRVAKFMRAVLVLAADNHHAEVMYALMRPIAESAVTVRFLAAKDDEKLYTRFVEYSLGPERELYDIIQRNIGERGGTVLPIEQQMLDSINVYCERSGLKITDISPKDPDWGGNVRQRLDAIGAPDAYAALLRGPSHAIHGSWVDLMMRHLSYEDGKFSPALESDGPDVRFMLPIARFVLVAAHEYLTTFYGDHAQLRPLRERIADLDRRLSQLDNAHRAWRDAAWHKRREQGAQSPDLADERGGGPVEAPIDGPDEARPAAGTAQEGDGERCG